MGIKPLTSTQKTTLTILSNYIKQYRYSPSYRELLVLLGKRSLSTIKYDIDILKQKGYITYEPYKNRTIRIIKEN